MVFTEVVAFMKLDPGAHGIYSSGFTFKTGCDTSFEGGQEFS